jgi:hypothetical protein
VVAVTFGLLMLIPPGRPLTLLGWAPIDPMISRLLGAALLALGWSSFLKTRFPLCPVATNPLSHQVVRRPPKSCRFA